MYKELTICLIIVVLVITLSIITEKNTKDIIQEMDEELSRLEGNIYKEENKNSSKQMEEIMHNWKEKKEILKYYIEHDELEKVETELHELEAKIKTKNYDEGITNVEKAIFILNHIDEKYKLRIQNIF